VCSLTPAVAPQYLTAPGCAGRSTGFSPIGRFRPFTASYSCLMKPADDQKIFLGCQLNILRRKRLALAGMRLVAIAERRAREDDASRKMSDLRRWRVNWMRTSSTRPLRKKKSRNAKPGARCFCFLECDRTLQPLRHLHDCSDGFRLERMPGEAGAHWKAPPLHGASQKRPFASPILCNLRRPLCEADTSESQLLENFGPSGALSGPRVTSGRFVDRAPWSATRRRGAPRGLLTPR
jgi:hypothetical protein